MGTVAAEATVPQEQVQLLVGRFGIAQMELHGLAWTEDVADGEEPLFVIHLDDIAHQKFVGFGRVFYFRAGNAQ